MLRALGVVTCLSLAACGSTGAAPPGVAWHATDVAPHGRPKLVFVAAQWAAASGEMDHRVFTAPDVVAESARFDMVRLDVTDGLGSAGHEAAIPYRTSGAPTVVLLRSDGAEATRFSRFVDAQTLLAAMREVR